MFVRVADDQAHAGQCGNLFGGALGVASCHYDLSVGILAADAANGFLFQPQFPTIARKEVKGVWKDMPIFANDLSALSWA